MQSQALRGTRGGALPAGGKPDPQQARPMGTAKL